MCFFERCTCITFVESTIVPMCHNLWRHFNKEFAGLAKVEKALGMVLRIQTTFHLQWLQRIYNFLSDNSKR